ncbi:MAG TPA: efflux RND transporter periplasmic adaptor subunit [Bacteroidales bacterium]|jgi:RND family efflux transporter MFP subunit|nr:efflux RND transporter periplasmic adaptor subunit [Bacteroidales bacterium]
MRHLILYVLVIITAFSSCSKKQVENTEHDHSAVKLKLTAYSDQLEVFAEADPFVKGETSTILAHFTKLSDFKPLGKSTITARLAIRNKDIAQTIDNPVRPGIYEFALQPDEIGEGQLIFDIQSGEEKYTIKINPVVVYQDEHTAILIAEKKEIDELNSISFTKEQSWKIGFETTLPSFESFGKIIKTTAHIITSQDNETIITAKTNGIVKFQQNILEGETVKAGESFISISGSGLASDNAEVRYQEAKNNYELAKADYERKKALSQNKIISEKELESAKAAYDNAKAIFDNLKINFSSNGQSVFSTQNGVIKHVYVNNGQHVEAGDALFSVSDNSKLIVKAEVQQKDYPYLNSIISANIKSSMNKKVYGLDELDGKLISYGKNIDDNEAYLVPVYFEINSTLFLPGSFVEVFIKTKTKGNSLLVPNSSLIEEQGDFFVFVQLTPELFEKREVKIGVSDGIQTEVLSGLNESERIVSKGAIIVKLAAVSNSLDPHAGHVH